MFKRFVLVFFATALAVMLLFMTMLYDPAESNRTNRSDVELDSGSGWTLGDKPQKGPPAVLRPGQGTGDVIFVKENRAGQLTVFFGDKVRALPQGMLQIASPRIRIHLRRNERVVQISADEGTVVAPDNQLRSGDLQGAVVITLFECAAGQELDYSRTSPHIRLRMTMPEVQFDLELGQVESSGLVHLTMGGNDFRGRGLKLKYDEVNRRIERLQIARGEKLVLVGRDAAGVTEKPAAAAGKKGRRQPADTQYYRASFSENVQVAAPGLEIADGDSLVVFLAVSQELDEDGLFGAPAAPDEQPVGASAGAHEPNTIASIIRQLTANQTILLLIYHPHMLDFELLILLS